MHRFDSRMQLFDCACLDLIIHIYEYQRICSQDVHRKNAPEVVDVYFTGGIAANITLVLCAN